MRNTNNLLWLFLLFCWFGNLQGQLHSFKDDVESQADFEQKNLIGWTSLDLDGYNSAGPFQEYPGKGGPLGFIVYNPSETDPPNELDGYDPRSGKKYFVSVSSWDGPINDWLISDELANSTGGVFSFYAKSAADYMGEDEFKVAYSMTGSAPEDFIFLNNGNTIKPTLNWHKFEYNIPAGAKHVAINAVSYAVMLLIDDLEFAPTVAATAPGQITGFSVEPQLGADIKVNFNWDNPTIDFNGNALSQLTGVKIFRGTHPMHLIEIADLPSSIGQSMNFTDDLPSEGSYTYKLIPYNNSGLGLEYAMPLTFFGFENKAGAPTNVVFSQNANGQTEISWDEVNYGENGGVLVNPVVGYTILRTVGTMTETLVEMLETPHYVETSIPDLNLYTYTIMAQTSPTDLGVPTVVTAHSGMTLQQVSVTIGKEASGQPFELGNKSIISQSIYTPEELGEKGLITSISYFGNLSNSANVRYKIYMSATNRSSFGTTLNNAVWEYFGNQKLVFDGEIQFTSGTNAYTIELDQPFYYDGGNVVISIVKPLTENTVNGYPQEFYNTTVEGMRTYYANGYSVDLSLITTQPAAWSTDEVVTIPSIVVEKRKDYGQLSGTVTTMADESALEGVLVSIAPVENGYQMETALTDENGSYIVPALIPGNYTATFTKNAFNTIEIDFTIEANEQKVIDVVMDNSLPIVISGKVEDINGTGIEGVTLNLSGFTTFTTTTDASGHFSLEAFATKQYDLEAVHSLYTTESISFESEADDFVLDPIVMTIAAHKPVSVFAVNNNDVGEVSWGKPVGYSNETMIGWGSFLTAGDAWGNGGDPFMAGIRFETTDLENQVPENAELTHVKVYFANHAEVLIKVFEGNNAENLVHQQKVSIPEEDWYVIELTNSWVIDPTKELWIGVDFLAAQYGSYPIGLDDGPNAPGRKGSMKYENGSWAQMSLTNKNWNIYGITNQTTEANPLGYKVYRSPAAEESWTELTTAPIATTSFDDTTLSDADPNMYKYGVEAFYGNDLISEKGISNEIEHKMFFDFELTLITDFGSAEGAYISMWNDENFTETFMPNASSVTIPHLMHGNYHLSVELENYEMIHLSDVEVGENGALTVELNLLKVQPSSLNANVLNSTSAEIDWALHQTFTERFERFEDFERQTIGNYLMKDLDGLPTYEYNNFTWPDAGVPMAYMIFNPFATTPAVEMSTISGRRFLSGFAGPNGANNDWFIVPAGSGEFKFSAASLVGSQPERIRVWHSQTGTDVSDFTAFGSVMNVPANWTEYTFEAPENTRYVAIQFVSNDSYILKIDDMTYEKAYDHAVSYNIYLDGTLVAENVLDKHFTLEGLSLSTQSHLAEVEAVYATGVSEKTEVLIAMLGVEDPLTNDFKVYPNPSKDQFWIELEEKSTVNIYDLNGRVLYSKEIHAGKNSISHEFPAGTYILTVQSKKGKTSKKLIFL